MSRQSPPSLKLAALALAASVVLAAAVLLIFSSVASAHAAFVRSEPAPNSVLSEPPDAVTIWFTEPVEPRLSRIDVFDAAGKRVNAEEATGLPEDPNALTARLPRLPDGTYTVAFRNLSAVDGHPLSGSFLFSVGVSIAAPPVPVPVPEQPILPSPAEPVLRWLGLLSILAMVGCLVFELFISGPVLEASTVEASTSMETRMNSRTFKLTWVASGIFAVASLGELLVKTSVANNLPLLQIPGRSLMSMLQTGWGGLWLWRISILVGLMTVLVLAWLDRRQRPLSSRREWQIVTLAFAAGILLTISLASHGAAITEIRAAAVFSDYLHLLAAGFWVGGIIYLAMVVPAVMKSQKQQEAGKNQRSGVFCPASHVVAMRQFSSIAILSVGILVITGLFNSWAQVTLFSALATPYGVTLLAKLGLLVPLLALGAVNLLWVRPRLAGNSKALQLLGRTVTAEAILAVLLLLAVGILVSLEPARQVASRQELDQTGRLVLQETSGGVNARAIIEPDTLGPNLVTVFLTDRSGKPIANASSVTFQLIYLDQDIGTFTEDIIDHGGGIWVAHEAIFSLEGNWQALLIIRRPDAFDTRITFRFRFPPPAGSSILVPSARTGNLLWGMEVSVVGFLLGGVGLYLGGRKTRASMVTMVCGGITILAGILMTIIFWFG